MSNLNLIIGGRDYAVACAPGEEMHITALGEMIDAKLAATPATAGSGEARTLLFAALLLADELHEARAKPRKASAASAVTTPDVENADLERIALRIENLAAHLEASLNNA